MNNKNQNGASFQQRVEAQKESKGKKVEIDWKVFQNTPAEKLRISKEKSEYKANFNRPKFQAERADLLEAFARIAKSNQQIRMNVRLIVL